MSQTSAWQWKLKHWHLLSGGLSQEVTVYYHTYYQCIIFMDSMSLLQKVAGGMGNPDWHIYINVPCSTSTFKDYSGYMYYPVYDRVKGSDHADRLVGEAVITSGLNLGRSEVLSSLRHYQWADWSQIHHSWRREVQKEELLDDLSGKDEKKSLSLRPTFELFQRQCAKNVWDVEHNGVSQADKYCLHMNWTLISAVMWTVVAWVVFSTFWQVTS